VDVRRVIAGTSGSPGSLAALRYAEWLASSHDAILVPLLAWEPPCSDGGGTLQPTGYLHREWHDMAWQRMRRSLLAVWGKEPDGLRVRPKVEQGPAGCVLVEVARHPGDVLPAASASHTDGRADPRGPRSANCRLKRAQRCGSRLALTTIATL
jgi:Universal stress protein family